MPLPISELQPVLAPSSLNLFFAKSSGYVLAVCKICGFFEYRMAFSWRPDLKRGVHREKAVRNSHRHGLSENPLQSWPLSGNEQAGTATEKEHHPSCS